MSAKEILFDVLVAALSVIGFYGVLHGVFESLLVPRELATAVLLEGWVSPEELDMLLCEARRAPFGGRRRVVLVIPLTLLNEMTGDGGELEEAYAEVLEKYGAVLGVCASEAEREYGLRRLSTFLEKGAKDSKNFFNRH